MMPSRLIAGLGFSRDACLSQRSSLRPAMSPPKSACALSLSCSSSRDFSVASPLHLVTRPRTSASHTTTPTLGTEAEAWNQVSNGWLGACARQSALVFSLGLVWPLCGRGYCPATATRRGEGPGPSHAERNKKRRGSVADERKWAEYTSKARHRSHPVDWASGGGVGMESVRSSRLGNGREG